MGVVGDIQVVCGVMCLVTGRSSESGEGVFLLVGFFHQSLLKLFPIITNQLFCFLCCFFLFFFFFLDLGKLVTDSVPMQGNKVRNLPLPP